jgi:putative thioredoxin
MGTNTFDAAAATFDQDVVEASKTVPIVVDFWAPWCGPCRVIKPILEKLAAEYGGKFLLAKVNTDENPDIAARYGVRGIPNVKAFVDGRVANEFTGALPESGVRSFIENVLPSAGEELRVAAAADIAQGDATAAEAKLRHAITLEPEHDAAHVDLAELLLARPDVDAAEAALAAVPGHRRDDRAAALATRIALLKKLASLPDLATLRARVDAQPDDLDARLAYAQGLAAGSTFAPALDELLEIVRRGRGERREQARKAIVDIFGLAVDQPDLVSDYRRKLAGVLY